jgi:polysaccharide export outer membrane protein
MLMLAQGAAAQPATVTPPVAKVAQADSDSAYVLGPDDVVEVEVLGQTYKQRSKIGTDGNIQLPFVGPVPAANKTQLQLAADVKDALEKGGFFREPIMRVEVVSFASRYVTFLGAVRSPGLVPVDRPYRLSELIARVGGVVETGADFVTVTPERGASRNLSVKDSATGDPANDPVILPGTRLYVPLAEKIYVTGQVKAPGAFPYSSDMTIRQALARAGGLTDIGSERSIKVTHPDGHVDKPGVNAKVGPNDVINVGERLF